MWRKFLSVFEWKNESCLVGKKCKTRFFTNFLLSFFCFPFLQLFCWCNSSSLLEVFKSILFHSSLFFNPRILLGFFFLFPGDQGHIITPNQSYGKPIQIPPTKRAVPPWFFKPLC